MADILLELLAIPDDIVAVSLIADGDLSLLAESAELGAERTGVDTECICELGLRDRVLTADMILHELPEDLFGGVVGHFVHSVTSSLLFIVVSPLFARIDSYCRFQVPLRLAQ